MAESVRSAMTTTKKAAKKAAARPGPRADKADGESAVLPHVPHRAPQGNDSPPATRYSVAGGLALVERAQMVT